MSKYFKTPFAASGDKSAVPDDLQLGGEVSYTEGWTPDYEADQNTDPNAKDVERQSENGIKHDITEALKEIQEYGYKVYAADVVYPVGGRAPGSDGNVYRAAIENGPSTGAGVVDPVGDNTGTWVNADGDLGVQVNGYSVLSNGQILQWYSVLSSAVATTPAPFPIPFPNSALRAYATAEAFVPVGANTNNLQVGSVNVDAWDSSAARVSANVTVWVVGF